MNPEIQRWYAHKLLKRLLPALTVSLLTLSATFLSLRDASAQTYFLFNNGFAGTNSFEGYYADTGYPYTEAGNVFTPTASGTVAYVEFAGSYGTGSVPTSDDFTLTLYSTIMSGGNYTPDSVIGTSTISGLTEALRGVDQQNNPTYEFAGFLDSEFTLNAGTYYYLGFSDTTTPYAGFALETTEAIGPATLEYSFYNGSFVEETLNNNQPFNSLSFDLQQSGTIPEPSTYTLIGIGMMILSLVRQRKFL